MAFDLSNAKPVQESPQGNNQALNSGRAESALQGSEQGNSGGGFNLSSARPVFAGQDMGQNDETVTRTVSRQGGGELQERAKQNTDFFEGLPDDIAEKIRKQSLNARDRRGRLVPEDERTIDKSRARKLSNLERIRLENPHQAELIESLNPIEKAAIGYQQGLRQAARGAGKIIGQDFFPDANDKSLKQLSSVSDAAKGGKIVGQAAPFVAAAPLTGTVGTGLRAASGGARLIPSIANNKARAGAISAFGGAEGGIIAAGEDRSAGEIAQSAALGATVGLVAEGAPAAISTTKESIKKAIRGTTERDIRRGLASAAPTPDKLRQESKAIYQAVRDSGAEISEDSYTQFLRDAMIDARAAGLDLPKGGPSLTAQSALVVDRLLGILKNPIIRIDDLERTRRQAQNAASVATRSDNLADANVNNSIVDSIDGYLSELGDYDFVGGTGNLGKELRAARSLWGRARKSELLSEAVTKADNQASGIENGIRIQFRHILNNKKKRRFFTNQERDALESVVQGKTTTNTLKRLGKMGFGSGQQTNVLSGLASSGVGSVTLSTMFGSLGAGVGMVLLPTVGTISATLAKRLTANGAEMANQIIRSGTDANQIARKYYHSVPKDERSIDDLSALLMRPDIPIEGVNLVDVPAEVVTLALRKRSSAAAAPAAAVAAQEEPEIN